MRLMKLGKFIISKWHWDFEVYLRYLKYETVNTRCGRFSCDFLPWQVRPNQERRQRLQLKPHSQRTVWRILASNQGSLLVNVHHPLLKGTLIKLRGRYANSECTKKRNTDWLRSVSWKPERRIRLRDTPLPHTDLAKGHFSCIIQNEWISLQTV